MSAMTTVPEIASLKERLKTTWMAGDSDREPANHTACGWTEERSIDCGPRSQWRSRRQVQTARRVRIARSGST